MLMRLFLRGSVNIDRATLRSSARFVCPENDSDLVNVEVMIRESSCCVPPSEFEFASLLRP